MDTRFSMLLPRLSAYQAAELLRVRRRDEQEIRLRSSRTQPKSVACFRGNPGLTTWTGSLATRFPGNVSSTFYETLATT